LLGKKASAVYRHIPHVWSPTCIPHKPLDIPLCNVLPAERSFNKGSLGKIAYLPFTEARWVDMSLEIVKGAVPKGAGK
jgi:hypothetical protein